VPGVLVRASEQFVGQLGLADLPEPAEHVRGCVNPAVEPFASDQAEDRCSPATRQSAVATTERITFIGGLPEWSRFLDTAPSTRHARVHSQRARFRARLESSNGCGDWKRTPSKNSRFFQKLALWGRFVATFLASEGPNPAQRCPVRRWATAFTRCTERARSRGAWPCGRARSRTWEEGLRAVSWLP